ncbi:beta-ketoacyl synthase chain length factor [Kribbella sp. CA-245084]|uniref:beta-ketoacyl synthase chain length factor n=1 Tax=Kribbella sp. CA-245084 TaxID=3239940 RepID=UPI003D8F72D5
MKTLAEGRWDGGELPGVPGFVGSAFNPMVVAAAERCLAQVDTEPLTGIVLVSEGDRAGAEHVRQAVAEGKRIGPLYFFQSVPNSIAGWIAAKWELRGPVVCVTNGGPDEAELLLADGDAEQVLIVQVTADRAFAQIVSGGDPT